LYSKRAKQKLKKRKRETLTMATKTIKNKLINELVNCDKYAPTISKLARNLNLLSLEDKLAPTFFREAEMYTIKQILLRRNKPNPLLTGFAGVGKTAIAEGLASLITEEKLKWLTACDEAKKQHDKAQKKLPEEEQTEFIPPKKSPLCDMVVYDFSMNGLLAGTQYRGTFEEKIQLVIRECVLNPNIVLFIDEIHMINSLGAGGQDDRISLGQILKPALARGSIRVIGATTTEESKILKSDKALARRFSEVVIEPLQGEAKYHTAQLIFNDYLKYHNLSIEKDGIGIEALCDMIDSQHPGTFPNNFIDVIDEAMSEMVLNEKQNITFADLTKNLNRIAHYKKTIGFNCD
jgi:ATP-dependent Clp protease ATP-binding subunit ClpA